MFDIIINKCYNINKSNVYFLTQKQMIKQNLLKGVACLSVFAMAFAVGTQISAVNLPNNQLSAAIVNTEYSGPCPSNGLWEAGGDSENGDYNYGSLVLSNDHVYECVWGSWNCNKTDPANLNHESDENKPWVDRGVKTGCTTLNTDDRLINGNLEINGELAATKLYATDTTDTRDLGVWGTLRGINVEDGTDAVLNIGTDTSIAGTLTLNGDNVAAKLTSIDLNLSDHETRIAAIENNYLKSKDLKLLELASSDHETRIGLIENDYAKSSDINKLDLSLSDHETRIENLENKLEAVLNSLN
jgi:hypothetical protein